MKGGLAHRDAMAVHAVRRLFLRHGIAISRGEYWMICKTIEDGHAPALAVGRAGGTIHCIAIDQKPVYAIWNAEERAIATFLLGVPQEVHRRMVDEVRT